MAILPEYLMEMMKNKTMMKTMMSLMTEMTVDLDQVVEKFQRSLLMTSEDIFDKDKDPEEMTLQELIDAQPDHWKSGKAGDGKVYLNDDGEKVKLNVKGYPYKIGDDGRRMFKTSLRPKGTYSPEEWRKLSQSDRNTILKSEKKKLEKKEADDKAKRLVEEKKKKALKKEKKDSKKDKDEPKSKDDEGGDESKKGDSHSKSKKSDAGVGEVVKNKVTLPITCTSTYLDLYDIVDDDDVHGKRYIDCRKVKRNADASPCFRCFLLMSRTMRNISLNGMNGRRSREDVAQKHRGVVKFGAHCQVRFRDSPWLRQANRQ